jgi:hypothetical protein
VILATRQRGKREVGFAAKVLEQLKRHHVELEAPASSDFHMHVSQMLSRMGVREKKSLPFLFLFLFSFSFLFLFLFLFLFPLRGRVVAGAGVCSSCVAGALVLFFFCVCCCGADLVLRPPMQAALSSSCLALSY